MEAVGFYNRYDDLIVTVGSFQGSSRYRSDNIANARSRGLELGLTGRHRFGGARAADVNARVAYTMVDSEVLALDRADDVQRPFEVGQTLLRRPRHQLSVEAGLAAGRLTAFLTGGARSRTLDIEPSFGTFGGLFFNKGFNVWNGGASWRVYRTAHLFGRVENLFDRRYEEAFGFPALGRRATIGLRIAAGG
jgi:vitamin B12 transporter